MKRNLQKGIERIYSNTILILGFHDVMISTMKRRNLNRSSHVHQIWSTQLSTTLTPQLPIIMAIIYDRDQHRCCMMVTGLSQEAVAF